MSIESAGRAGVRIRMDATAGELAEMILPFERPEYYDRMRKKWTDVWVGLVADLVELEDAGLSGSPGYAGVEGACTAAEEMLVHINLYARTNGRSMARYDRWLATGIW